MLCEFDSWISNRKKEFFFIWIEMGKNPETMKRIFTTVY